MSTETHDYLTKAKEDVAETADLINSLSKDSFTMDSSQGEKTLIMRLLANTEAGVCYCKQKVKSITRAHAHPHSVEYLIVIRGTILCLEREYKSSESCLIPPEQPHTVEALTDCSYISITLPCEEAYK